MKCSAILSSYLSAAMVLLSVPAMAAGVHECVSQAPTAASRTWDFKGEANSIFQQIQLEAQPALDHANKLETDSRQLDLSWETDADQLNALKREVNDMGAQVCRLETIRRVVAPWQQREIDRIVTNLRLMADNTQDAIVFCNNHHNDMWLPTFAKYADNLYNEASKLNSSVDNAVAYAKTSQQYGNLKREMAAPAD